MIADLMELHFELTQETNWRRKQNNERAYNLGNVRYTFCAERSTLSTITVTLRQPIMLSSTLHQKLHHEATLRS